MQIQMFSTSLPEFISFGVPLSIFVCAGWTASYSAATENDALARAAAAIQWYSGEPKEVVFGRGRKMVLLPENKANNIGLDHRRR